MMGNVKRKSIGLGSLLEDGELQKRFHIEAYWLPELPKVSGVTERYEAAASSSRPYDGNGQGHLVIASPALRDDRYEMLLFSFPVDELYGISILSTKSGIDAIQIQSVQKGTIISGYRELTAAENGLASTRVGYFKPRINRYHT